jgi:hypothetical protein
MPDKAPARVSAIATILLLILFDFLSVFVQMLALNGVSERQGLTAMGVALLCQGIIAILAGIFAGWLTNFAIIRFNWNRVLAVVLAVSAGTLSGAALSFFSFIVAVPLAGIG